MAKYKIIFHIETEIECAEKDANHRNPDVWDAVGKPFQGAIFSNSNNHPEDKFVSIIKQIEE